MPATRYYQVTQVRKVTVRVEPKLNESYARAAMRVAEEAFENPGDFFNEEMSPGVTAMPAITSTSVERVLM